MQNATALANPDSTTPQNFTTASLQKEKVEIHALPLCGASGAACTASGVYINDDGETLDMSKRNTYTISYTHTPNANATAAPDTLTMTITATGQKSMIN